MGHPPFTGREFDAETAVYYYRARYYDPQAGRFVSEDPLALLGGINMYKYVLNSPTRFIDPSGLCEQESTRRPIYCNPDVIQAMKKIWSKSGNGTTGTEAAFLLNGSDVQYRIMDVGYTNERNHMTFRIQGNTFAIFHVHPNTSSWKPSTPANNAENNGRGDTGLADEHNLEMYVVSKDGLGKYDPVTRQSVKVRNGLDWAKPCPEE